MLKFNLAHAKAAVTAYAIAIAFSLAVPLAAAPFVEAAKLGANADPVSSLIVRFEPEKTAEFASETARGDRVVVANAALSRFGVALSYSRTLASGAELLKLDRPMSISDATAMAAAVARLPGIRYAVPNRIIRTQRTPNDPQFSELGQWGFKYSPGNIEGANFVGAWDITTGSAAQTIGIVDGGVDRSEERRVGKEC